MQFYVCDCPKESNSLACVYTGILFEHGGKVYTGDMFFCRYCGTLSIHGIPNVDGVPGVACRDESSISARFHGHFDYDLPGKYLTTKAGIITLLPKGVEYLAKYDSYVLNYGEEP